MKEIPIEFRRILESLPDGVCPIVIFGGHFVDPTKNHGIRLNLMDELHGWYEELEELNEEGLPPNWIVGGTGCYHEEIYERLTEKFPKQVLNMRRIKEELPDGSIYEAKNKQLTEREAPFTLGELFRAATKKAGELCKRKACTEVRIVVCCSKHMKEAIDNVKNNWPNITPTQEGRVRQLCDSGDRKSGDMQNVFTCKKKKRSS